MTVSKNLAFRTDITVVSFIIFETCLVKRNHRLDIRLQFTAFVLHADIPVVIHLDGQRDEISDRIGQLLGEISIACQNRLVKEQRDNTSANSKL